MYTCTRDLWCGLFTLIIGVPIFVTVSFADVNVITWLSGSVHSPYVLGISIQRWRWHFTFAATVHSVSQKQTQSVKLSEHTIMHVLHSVVLFKNS